MLIAKLIHILGFTIWVGGMFFSYVALRPAAGVLEPAMRMTLWVGTLQRFFRWVWVSIALIFGSGIYMITLLGSLPHYVTAMFFLGVVMTFLFLIVSYVPFASLKHSVAAQNWASGAKSLGQIRTLVGVNLVLGLATIVIGAAGPLAR